MMARTRVIGKIDFSQHDSPTLSKLSYLDLYKNPDSDSIDESPVKTL